MTLTANRSIVEQDYRFDEKEHVHELYRNGEWRPLIGVSSVVKNITDFGIASYYGSRRALMELGYDPKKPNPRTCDHKEYTEAVKRCELEATNSLERIKGLTAKDWQILLDKAYRGGSSYSAARAKKGTDSHERLSQWINLCIAENEGFPMPTKDPVVQKFIEMTAEWNPQFIRSEKHGYNEELWIGGICDLIVLTTQGLGIWDFKDRPAIYEKDILQMGGYAHLFPLEFTHVLGIPLEGEEVKAFYDMPRLKDAFVSQLNTYKFLNSLKEHD